MNQDHIDIENNLRTWVAEAIKEQLAKPARAVVNSESAFVADRLRKNGYTGVAARYWSWVCGRCYKQDEFGQEVYELQRQLEEIDKGVTMPEWGTYGT